MLTRRLRFVFLYMHALDMCCRKIRTVSLAEHDMLRPSSSSYVQSRFCFRGSAHSK